jgi:hypothetical protein
MEKKIVSEVCRLRYGYDIDPQTQTGGTNSMRQAAKQPNRQTSRSHTKNPKIEEGQETAHPNKDPRQEDTSTARLTMVVEDGRVMKTKLELCEKFIMGLNKSRPARLGFQNARPCAFNCQ